MKLACGAARRKKLARATMVASLSQSSRALPDELEVGDGGTGEELDQRVEIDADGDNFSRSREDVLAPIPVGALARTHAAGPRRSPVVHRQPFPVAFPSETGVVVAWALLAYLLGSISFGLLLARRAGVDLRSTGSGNVGATNVRRALGRGPARLVLGLDALKGFVPVAAGALVWGPSSPVPAAGGVAAAVGHCFPVWHGFRGGKAAATGAGALLAAVPLAGLEAMVTYLLLRRASGRASVGSLAGSLVGAAATAALLPLDDPRVAMSGAILLLVVVRHAGNIRRLLRGEEPPG